MVLRLILQGMLIAGVLSPERDTQTGVEGSKHDFSRLGWSGGELCQPCHTPHTAAQPEAAPLWDVGPNARDSYTLYDGTRGLPGPGSLVCLSCHDGSVALDATGGMHGEMTIEAFDGGRLVIGRRGDLRQDHPIGVEYPDHDRYYHPRAQVEAGGDVTLPDGRVECLSCHDVHNPLGNGKLLVKPNQRSALCLTCHRK